MATHGETVVVGDMFYRKGEKMLDGKRQLLAAAAQLGRDVGYIVVGTGSPRTVLPLDTPAEVAAPNGESFGVVRARHRPIGAQRQWVNTEGSVSLAYLRKVDPEAADLVDPVGVQA